MTKKSKLSVISESIKDKSIPSEFLPTPILPGDILLCAYLHEPSDYVVRNNFLDLKDSIHHSACFVDSPQYPIAHSTTNQLHGISLSPVSQFFNAGNHDRTEDYLVLRFKDKKLRTAIAEAASSWAHRFSKERMAKLKAKIYEDEQPPFTPYSVRNPDKDLAEDLQKAKNLLRCFRAYFRMLDRKPLSKEKGISCGALINYCIQVGLIVRFFSEDFLRINIKPVVEEFTKIGLKNIQGDLSVSLQEKLVEPIQRYILTSEYKGENFLGLESKGLIEWLSYPSKSASSTEMYRHLCRFPQLASCINHVVITCQQDKSEAKYNLWAVPHTVLEMVALKTDPSKNYSEVKTDDREFSMSMLFYPVKSVKKSAFPLLFPNQSAMLSFIETSCPTPQSAPDEEKEIVLDTDSYIELEDNSELLSSLLSLSFYPSTSKKDTETQKSFSSSAKTASSPG